jgi:dihydrofolate reductase
MSQTFSLEAILAIAMNNAIGLQGKLPWHLPSELNLFKEITSGHTLIMGRRTFESLPGILPNREHIVISQSMKALPGIHNASSTDHALSIAGQLSSQKVFVIGGGQVFDALLSKCSVLHVSRIMLEPDADTLYTIDLRGFRIDASHTMRDARQGIDILYQRYTI